MQNKMIKLVVLTVIFCLYQNVRAGHVINAAKIGVINSEIIMKTPELIKQYQDEIANMQRTQEELIKSLDLDLEKRYNALTAKAKISDIATLEKEQDALKDAKDKRDLEAKAASERIQRTANRVMEQFGKLVQEAAQNVLQALGLDLIIDKNATLAYNKAIDITNELIAEIKAIQAKSVKPAVTTKETTPKGK
jgi:Skp family chaperone for outer membrane proteins